jgi:hypothetical protein
MSSNTVINPSDTSPVPEFFVDDNASELMNRIADGYIELAKLRIEYDDKKQQPELQLAYKQVLEHKGYLLSQLVVKFYMSAMGAISDLEVVGGTVAESVKLKYSSLP